MLPNRVMEIFFIVAMLVLFAEDAFADLGKRGVVSQLECLDARLRAHERAFLEPVYIRRKVVEELPILSPSIDQETEWAELPGASLKIPEKYAGARVSIRYHFTMHTLNPDIDHIHPGKNYFKARMLFNGVEKIEARNAQSGVLVGLSGSWVGYLPKAMKTEASVKIEYKAFRAIQEVTSRKTSDWAVTYLEAEVGLGPDWPEKECGPKVSRDE